MAKIPKIIHQLWIGSSIPVPNNWLNTFQEMNPEFEYILWDESKLAELDMKNRHLFDNCEKLYQKADIARYEILYKYGGFWFDADMVCLQNLSTLTSKEIVLAYERPKHPDDLIANSVIGVPKNSSLISKLIESIPEQMTKHNIVWKQTGPLLLTETINNYFPELNKQILPYYYFYPFDKKSTKIITNLLTHDKKTENDGSINLFNYTMQWWCAGKKNNYNRQKIYNHEKVLTYWHSLIQEIFVIGSCRVTKPIKMAKLFSEYDYQHFHAHYSSEVLQFIQFMINQKDIPTNVHSQIFRDQSSLKYIASDKMKKCFQNAKIVVIELSSIKTQKLPDSDYFVNVLNKCPEYIQSIESEEILTNNILQMCQLLSDKKIILVPHINAWADQSKRLLNARSILQSVIKKFDGLVTVFDPANYLPDNYSEYNKYFPLTESGKVDINHYSDYFLDLISTQFKNILNL